MFLATTGLTEFWDKHQELLFLGPWCLPSDRRHSDRSLGSQLLPSPWRNQNRFRQAAEYLDSCQERMLQHLADYLNTVHQISLSRRAWRILIGPWLIHSLHVTYDRFILLRNAFERYPDLQTWVLDPRDFQTPQTTSETELWNLEHSYNLQLFSQLLQSMGYAFAVKPMPRRSVQENARGSGWLATTSRHFLKQSQKAFGKALGDRWGVALCDPYLPRAKRWTLAWATNFKVLPLDLGVDRSAADFPPSFDSKRKGLGSLTAENPFETAWIQMLPQNFPTVYLEGFLLLRAQARRELSQMPSVILSGSGWYAHEPLKFMAAEAADAGKRLIGSQHGSGYGLCEALPQERHERKICDTFYVWGWAKAGEANLRNLPAPKLSAILDKGAPSRLKSQCILLVTTTNPTYFFRFTSAPQAHQLEEYFEWESRFLSALQPTSRSKTVFRPHPHPYGHQLRERFTGPFPEIRWDERGTFQKRVTKNHLVVVDHPGTPALEALVANVPTVMFWNPQHWPVRESVQQDLEALRNVELLFHTPEAAAAKVEQLLANPWAWWRTAPVQSARLAFIQKYALASSEWHKAWHDAMKEEVAAAVKQKPIAPTPAHKEKLNELLTT